MFSKRIFSTLLFLAASSSQSFGANLEFQNIAAPDGASIQICYRFPDPKKFPGKHPAVMIVPGSSRYDSCRALEKAYSDDLNAKGIIVFTRQKRGLSRNLATGELSMIESFASLFTRQFYVLLPREIIKGFDKNLDGRLSKDEFPDSELLKYGLARFSVIDQNQDGFLDYTELSNEIKRVVAYSVKNNDDTFFLSDIGGQVPVNWYRSALKLGALGPQILKLKMPVRIYHGTFDTNTDVGSVRALQKQVEDFGMSGIHFSILKVSPTNSAQKLLTKYTRKSAAVSSDPSFKGLIGTPTTCVSFNN